MNTFRMDPGLTIAASLREIKGLEGPRCTARRDPVRVHPQRDRRVSVTELPTHVPGCGKRTGVCGFIPHCASAFRFRVSAAYGWLRRAPPCERVSIAGKSGGANRLWVACWKPEPRRTD